MTLEEIGRRAVALTDARAAVNGSGCEYYYAGTSAPDDPGEAPCWIANAWEAAHGLNVEAEAKAEAAP